MKISIAIITAFAITTAILVGGIDPTSIILIKTVAEKSITLTFHECSG
jgi:hypothetical protein